MAISTYNSENGEDLFKVYVNVRSKTNYSLRIQRKLIGIKTKREAEREENRLIRECERELATKESQGTSWGDLIERWEKSLLTDPQLAETTRQDYVAAIRNHTALWWKKQAADITRADIRELIHQLKATGKSNKFLSKTKGLLHKAFIYGIENRLIRGLDRSPAQGIQIARVEEKKPEILTIGEIKKLLVEARRYQTPWYPIWSMAILTGMRSGELYALLWTDVDWENKVISVSKSYNGRFKCIKSTKSGEYRAVPISSELLALLQEIKATAGTRPSILPRLSDWTRGNQADELRKFCLGIGIPSVRFHTLRACFATQLIRNGVPPIQIQKICGWKDLETMQRYIRLAGIEIEGATESLKVLPDADVAAAVVNLFTKEAVTFAPVS